jgi:hypothetical protein
VEEEKLESEQISCKLTLNRKELLNLKQIVEFEEKV